MTEHKIELSGSCCFTLTTYENIGHKDVCLDYTEHSSDAYYSDTETSIDINADKAREIVAFLQKAFPEIALPAQPQQEPVLCINPKVIDPATGRVRNGTGALTYSDEPCAGWSMPLYTSAQRKPLTDDFLRQSDYHLLHRFIETTEDDEGYDIGKEAVKRLAELGVVQSHGFGRYSVTMFGYWVHERYWEQNPSLPLKTNADRAIEAKLKEKNT